MQPTNNKRAIAGPQSAPMSEGRPVDVPLLRQFAPLDGSGRRTRRHWPARSSSANWKPGARCSRKAIPTSAPIWIVSGTIELREQNRTIGVIKGGTPEARNPLVPKLPRQITARAMDHVEYLAIDSELLDVMITWDQTGTYEVSSCRPSSRMPRATTG